MRSWYYHPRWPEGKIFDDANPPRKSDGWVEHRGELGLTSFEMGQQMVENAVRAELAEQAKEGRDRLDAEHKKKYGFEPPPRASTEQVANIMDNKTIDGNQTRPTLHVPKSKHFSRRT